MDTAPIPAVERDIAIDIVKRGLLISPAIILVAGLLRGVDGAVSAGIALGIVLLQLPRRGAFGLVRGQDLQHRRRRGRDRRLRRAGSR